MLLQLTTRMFPSKNIVVNLKYLLTCSFYASKHFTWLHLNLKLKLYNCFKYSITDRSIRANALNSTICPQATKRFYTLRNSRKEIFSKFRAFSLRKQFQSRKQKKVPDFFTLEHGWQKPLSHYMCVRLSLFYHPCTFFVPCKKERNSLSRACTSFRRALRAHA